MSKSDSSSQVGNDIIIVIVLVSRSEQSPIEQVSLGDRVVENLVDRFQSGIDSVSRWRMVQEAVSLQTSKTKQWFRRRDVSWVRVGKSVVWSSEQLSNKTLVVQQSLREDNIEVEINETIRSINSTKSILSPTRAVLVEARVPGSIEEANLDIGIEQGALSVVETTDSSPMPASCSVIEDRGQKVFLDDTNIEVGYDAKGILEVAESPVFVTGRVVFKSRSTSRIEVVSTTFEDVHIGDGYVDYRAG